jgi:hypothetical protein
LLEIINSGRVEGENRLKPVTTNVRFEPLPESQRLE